MTQAGLADRQAIHQLLGVLGSRTGKKRRKSTCSPICATSENTTVEAVPNNRMLNALPPSTPAYAVQAWNDDKSCTAMNANGNRCRTIQNGWVQSWKRLIRVMPCVTNGMTTSEETT